MENETMGPSGQLRDSTRKIGDNTGRITRKIPFSPDTMRALVTPRQKVIVSIEELHARVRAIA